MTGTFDLAAPLVTVLMEHASGTLARTESRQGQPGPEQWLVIRRNVDDPTEIKLYLSNVPEDIPLAAAGLALTMRYPPEARPPLAQTNALIQQGRASPGLQALPAPLLRSWTISIAKPGAGRW